MPSRDAAKHDYELTALFEEYRALYELVGFRMSALDRRAPVTAGLFGLALASLHSLPLASQLMVLLATPPALIWLMRTTVNHARSLEDVLRRIEDIEHKVNRTVGQQILGFQSLHPSRGRYVGGRTGYESVLAVLGSILLLLAAAVFQAHVLLDGSWVFELSYDLLLVSIGLLNLREAGKLSRYRYHAPVEPT